MRTPHPAQASLATWAGYASVLPLEIALSDELHVAGGAVSCVQFEIVALDLDRVVGEVAIVEQASDRFSEGHVLALYDMLDGRDSIRCHRNIDPSRNRVP